MATKTSARRQPAVPRRAAPRAAAPSLVYVYCIVQSETAPPTARTKPLPGAAPPRAVGIGASRWLVVADVPRSRFDAEALSARLHDLDWLGRCAVAHDAVVMNMMKTGPVVPMRLFTIFASEARAAAEVRRAARQISRTLRRVAGRAEYGVRISAASGGARAAPSKPVRTGRSFLEHKRDQLAARRRPASVAPEERARVFQRLAALSDAAQERPIPMDGARVWLDGAFLVALSDAPAFRREVRRLSRELLTDGHELVLTGPWPPYSFLGEHGVKA